MTVEVFSEKTPEETLAQLRSQGVQPRKFKRELKQMEKLFLKGELSKISNFSLSSVLTEDGEHFDELEFVVTARFVKNGDTYLAGESYSVNISKLIREMRQAMRLWSKT